MEKESGKGDSLLTKVEMDVCVFAYLITVLAMVIGNVDAVANLVQS